MIFFFPYVVRVVPPRPDWTAKTTAIGTVAVAAVAVFVALFAEWRASVRLREERGQHAEEIAEERRLADKRLADQLAHSDAQLAKQRAREDARLQEERRLALEREQFAEACAIQVVLFKSVEEGQEASRLIARLVNRGTQTITMVEVRFSTNGGDVMSPRRQVRMVSWSNLPPEMSANPRFMAPAEAAFHSNRLTPWDAGMEADTDLVGSNHLTDPRVMVRWTDRWGGRWEYKRGLVERLQGEPPWST